MTTPAYRIFVFTSDHYQWALKAWFWLLEKYWQPIPQVVVAGFTPPEWELPPYATYYSIGNFADYPAQKWSDAAIRFLQAMPDEVFVFMLEDYFLIRPVNTNAVSILYYYMQQFKYVARIDLTTDRLFSFGPRYPQDIPDYGHVGYLDLIQSDPTLQYHMSLITGIWRRDAMLEILQPGWTAQDVELAGTPRLSGMRDRYIVLGTRQWPVRHGLAFRASRPGILDTAYLRVEDIIELKMLGYLRKEG
jgi:hypothetical protein